MALIYIPDDAWDILSETLALDCESSMYDEDEQQRLTDAFNAVEHINKTVVIDADPAIADELGLTTEQWAKVVANTEAALSEWLADELEYQARRLKEGAKDE